MRLHGKVALITGAGRGIGKATALTFADVGADIIVTDISVEAVRQLADYIRQKYGAKCLACQMDVTDEQRIAEVVDDALAFFNKIDILVNNAGICQVGNIEQLVWSDWERMLGINVGGNIKCIKAVLPNMKARKYGKIVCLSSLAGQIGGIATGPNYAASKAAVACITKSLAKYCAPYNINVNAVSPGFIATDMTAGLNQDTSAVPLGRKGTPEEVADAILFLASERSRYITGTTLDVNGGLYMK